MDPDILAYYDRKPETDRLAAGPGLIERVRTQHILRRVLPPPPARVLDVGGATGVYATWLAGLGYPVRLVDPVPGHVAAARDSGVDAVAGDARVLAEPDASYDAVLLMGPLYHLTAPEERLAALGEAARVVRPGGVVVEGMAGWVPGAEAAFTDERMLALVASVEEEPALVGASAHILAIATPPS
jgi:SAM-dependent methyltransferase